jgi:hypothetical protein
MRSTSGCAPQAARVVSSWAAREGLRCWRCGVKYVVDVSHTSDGTMKGVVG